MKSFPISKRSNYYRGFDLAADAIIKASRGEYVAPAGYNQRRHGMVRVEEIFWVSSFLLSSFLS